MRRPLQEMDVSSGRIRSGAEVSARWQLAKERALIDPAFEKTSEYLGAKLEFAVAREQRQSGIREWRFNSETGSFVESDLFSAWLKLTSSRARLTIERPPFAEFADWLRDVVGERHYEAYYATSYADFCHEWMQAVETNSRRKQRLRTVGFIFVFLKVAVTSAFEVVRSVKEVASP